MRRLAAALVALALSAVTLQTASAQEGETWLTQEKVYLVTLIKVHPNMGEKYLNNLRRTWIPSLKEAIKEGLILDYKILSSITFDQGYNLMMITEHPNLASFDATDEWRKKIARIVKASEAVTSEEEADKIVSGVYPEIRTYLSDKILREIKFIE